MVSSVFRKAKSRAGPVGSRVVPAQRQRGQREHGERPGPREDRSSHEQPPRSSLHPSCAGRRTSTLLRSGPALLLHAHLQPPPGRSAPLLLSQKTALFLFRPKFCCLFFFFSELSPQISGNQYLSMCQDRHRYFYITNIASNLWSVSFPPSLQLLKH